MTIKPDAQTVPPLLASRRHTVRLLLIIAGIAFAGLFRSGTPAPASRLPLYLSVLFLQLLLLWSVNAGLRAQGFNIGTLVGRRWDRISTAIVDLLSAIAVVVLLRAFSFAVSHFFGPVGVRSAFLRPSNEIEAIAWVIVSVVSGCAEELVYRGYLQRQLWSLTGRLPLALLLQACIFALAHLYQGPKLVLVIVFYGLTFGLVAALRRSIIPGAIAHSAIDLLAGLAGR